MSWTDVAERIQRVTDLITPSTGLSGGNARVTKTRSKIKAGRGSNTATTTAAAGAIGISGSSKDGNSVLSSLSREDLLNAAIEITIVLKELNYVPEGISDITNNQIGINASDFDDVRHLLGEIDDTELEAAVEKERKEILESIPGAGTSRIDSGGTVGSMDTNETTSEISTSIAGAPSQIGNDTGTNKSATRGRGRGRPQGSTTTRSINVASPLDIGGSASTTATTVDSTNFNTNTSSLQGTTGSADTSVSPISEVSSGGESNKKLVTIGAKYGYPAPPPLSSYNGKIGRSFYSSPYNPSTPILPNSQVAYCPGKHSDSGRYNADQSEWILCRVLRIISETRFEIQDPEPDELHPQGQIFRASYKEVILVPLHLVSSSISKLKEYKSGTRVLAKYPETTTFYPAEVMESRNGRCMLCFEGEEEIGKLTPVDRVFVLPCPK